MNLSSYHFPRLIKEVTEVEILKVYILGKLLWAQEAHKKVFYLLLFKQYEGHGQLLPKKISKICSWLGKNVNFSTTSAVYEIHCLTDQTKLFLF